MVEGKQETGHFAKISLRLLLRLSSLRSDPSRVVSSVAFRAVMGPVEGKVKRLGSEEEARRGERGDAIGFMPRLDQPYMSL